ncbi:MAG: bifunctional riboflavin kinase/FAD synthetase [Endomicrobium sp.]|jgi:riboflavin kinase/FMN adenylyltransferase|nr:bifunctional riboflavin kinase/FAD synthetase [Endomicrobium sp.]
MKQEYCVITIGSFDGLHVGHLLLIKTVLQRAKARGLKSAAIVLEKPVRAVKGLLSLYDEKIEKLERCGLDIIAAIGVPSEILSVSPDEFFDEFLVKQLKIKELVCGCDFAFGKNRQGDIAWLKKKTKNAGIKLTIVKPLKISGTKVSSSKIRALLTAGGLEKANKLLGRPYSFNGTPFRDRGIGEKIGFPTVNLKVSKDKILPLGVFASVISKGQKIYPAITNIGTRPTFKAGNAIVPETHILNFKGKWGKSKTKVRLLKKIRAEKKFQSVEELKKQISKDIKKAKKIFGA